MTHTDKTRGVNRGFRKHFAWGEDGHGVSVYQLAGSDVTLEVSYGGGRAVVFVPTDLAESIGAALIQAAGFSDAESGAMRDAK